MSTYQDSTTSQIHYGLTVDQAIAGGLHVYNPPAQGSPAPVIAPVPSPTLIPSPIEYGIPYRRSGGGFAPTNPGSSIFDGLGFGLKILAWMALGAFCLWGLATYVVPAGSALVLSAPHGWFSLKTLAFEPTFTRDGDTFVYPASEVMKYRWYHRDEAHAIHLNGRDVVVNGNIDHAFIHANGNLTFNGNVTNATVVDSGWKVTAHDAENSAFTGHQVAVPTNAGNTSHLTPAQ